MDAKQLPRAPPRIVRVIVIMQRYRWSKGVKIA